MKLRHYTTNVVSKAGHLDLYLTWLRSENGIIYIHYPRKDCQWARV